MNLFGIPIEFSLFGATLIAIAIWHAHALSLALSGLVLSMACKLLALGVSGGGWWLLTHVGYEWSAFANVFLLLVCFSILANQFEQSAIPDAMPRLLPDNWTGGLALLALVFVLSTFLDNIA